MSKREMKSEDALAIIELLERAGIACWVDGGWGVDALSRRQTRRHSDLDLAIDRAKLLEAQAALEGMGLRQDQNAEPGLPARLVMADDTRQVDLHPLEFDDRGDGWQQLSEGDDRWGLYPAHGLTGQGLIGGRSVRCLTPELQLRFHKGYELTGKDEHDLKVLKDLPSHPREEPLINEFILTFVNWARTRKDVEGVLLVGSHARGQATASSDLDLVVVVDEPSRYTSGDAWPEQFGAIKSIKTEDWGAVTSLRVQYDDGLEVEFGLTSSEWTKTDPVDTGTRRVIQDGFRILLDPMQRLERLAKSVERSEH